MPSDDRQSTSFTNVDLPDKAELRKGNNTQELSVSLEVKREEHKAGTSFLGKNMACFDCVPFVFESFCQI
jgi:hypothetical protein